MKIAFQWAVCLSLTLMSACVSLLPESDPPKPRYIVSPVTLSAPAEEAVEWSLVVADPRTTRVYDSVRMAVQTGPGKIEYFAGGEWADRMPRLFQTALIETFQDTGHILAVGDRSAVPLADFVLQTEIRRAYYSIINDSKQVDVVVFARITDGKGTVYTAKRFEGRAPIDRESADAVSSGFNGAFSGILNDIAAWTIEQSDTRHQSVGNS